MSEVAKFLSQFIRKQMDGHGIVVWYDPQNNYNTIIDNLTLKGIPVLKFQGSFIQIRFELEPYLSQNETPKVLVYIPMDRSETNYALIEAEVAGCFLTPGHSDADKNTSLEHLAYRILKNIIPAELENFIRKVQAGEYGLQDIDYAASRGYGKKTGTLEMVFNSSDPVTILFLFLSNEHKDEVLQHKNALEELKKLIHDQLGISVNNLTTYKDIRNFLWRVVLINDFLISTTLIENPPDIFKQIPIISTKPAQSVCKEIIRNLQERSTEKATYENWAFKVEQEFRLNNFDLPSGLLQKCQTFPTVEGKLLQYVLQQFIEDKTKDIQSLIKKRLQTYWGSKPPFNVQWRWISQAFQLQQKAKEVLKELHKHKWTLKRLIDQYTASPDGWYQIDKIFHNLQTQYISLDANLLELHNQLELVWVKIRQVYTNFLRETAQILQEAILKESTGDDWLLQREVFIQYIQPELKQGAKMAYFLVDALRYEMATRIFNSLEGKYSTELHSAIAQLPAITVVGMGSLMPGAEKYLELDVASKGGLAVNIGKNYLVSRKDRIQYLQNILSDVPFYETHLRKIVQPGKAVREKIKQAQFIVVTSQEIDQMGETLDSWMAHQIMDGLITNLQQGILQLLNLGVETIVLTSDHGYLFGEELDPGEKIDSPGGKTVALHRRVWIGKGGISHPSFIRVPESRVGLAGDLELVFPKGIAAFKATGGNEVYFHGGISLQELVIPVMVFRAQKAATEPFGKGMIILKMDKQEITNRFFTIGLRYEMQEIFAEDKQRVRVLVQSGRNMVGQVVTANRGFEEGSGVLELLKDETCVATILLQKDPPPQTVDILVIDASSGMLMSQKTHITVRLMI